MGCVIRCFWLPCKQWGHSWSQHWSLTASAISSRPWILYSSQPSLLPHDYEMVLRVSVVVCFLTPIACQEQGRRHTSQSPATCLPVLPLTVEQWGSCGLPGPRTWGHESSILLHVVPRPGAAASPPPALGYLGKGSIEDSPSLTQQEWSLLRCPLRAGMVFMTHFPKPFLKPFPKCVQRGRVCIICYFLLNEENNPEQYF